ncbi:DUF7662 domain-containing protein [Arthrobacter sp. NQ4]|uniref:DUF7662 domain-containing protein n=1 Tax=Arthrobacter sp. NQ4 TaxID=3027930 RepID=UPI0023B09DF7|nr:hypothetical protein [Arthrobacter sp. NQ4]MDE8588363.1 hypothetical protein [Arthrobacter sp. NQ4]
MTPQDVVANEELLLRFRNEIAYGDRPWPSEEEARADSELLRSKIGGRIIAWLWPVEDYGPDSDPFEAVLQKDQKLWTAGVINQKSDDATKCFGQANGMVDRRRESRRQIAAKRFEMIIGSVAREVGCSAEEVKAHIVWSASASRLDLEQLLDGRTPFPFYVIARLCEVLRLEYADDHWLINDPHLLGRRIEMSIRASSIANHLRLLTLDNLIAVERRLPQRTNTAGPSQELCSYRAPEPGARYSSLYEALAADERSRPEYSLDQIDRLLLDAGELALPESARKSRSWWAGSGAKTEGRPQVSAWWGAGYRVGRVSTDPSTDEVVSIKFDALPGRAEWVANPKRTLGREYRLPGADRVQIRPDLHTPEQDRRKDHDEIISELASRFDFESFRKAISPTLAKLDAIRQSYIPDDPDLQKLIGFLDSVGEANRFQIQRHLSQGRNEPVDAMWLTNLLTRARRQGWTINKGSRKQPRWAALRLRALLLNEIAESAGLEPPEIEPEDAVPAQFLRRVAESVGVATTENSSALQAARMIIESTGGSWQLGFESADQSVTSLGLREIQKAIGWRMPPEDEIIVLS